jgi:hypothetical protein
MFQFGFGLEINGMIEGVCVFGQPPLVIQQFAFFQCDFNVLELCRLVIQTKAKNAASFLVGKALRMLPGPCSIVSYADSRYGHAGIVYQSTNWVYTGEVVSHDHLLVIDGKETHPRTLSGRGITSHMEWAHEQGIETIKPSPKYRYFYFIGTRKEKQRMLDNLLYPIVTPYPKLPKQRYDDGKPIIMPSPGEQTELFTVGQQYGKKPLPSSGRDTQSLHGQILQDDQSHLFPD